MRDIVLTSDVMAKKEDAEEYTEIEMPEEEEKHVKIVIDKLESANPDKIIRNVKEGKIVIVKIKELKESNMDELKHAINKIKNTCEIINGDVAGVGDEWLIVTPSSAKIER